MLWYAAWHAVSVFMPSFGALLPVRMLAVIAPAIFTPQAAACAGMRPRICRVRSVMTGVPVLSAS